MCGLHKPVPKYIQIYFQGSSKASNSFLSLCMLKTVARTLFFTLPKLR